MYSTVLVKGPLSMSNALQTINQKDLNDKIKAILDVLLSSYDLNVDIVGLLQEIPLKQNENHLTYIGRFIEHLGFDVRKERVVSLN
ncbi:MAG: hypothetical protein GY727_15010, partial [Gammaproteobacteria bacterium]|nr:hypothetical protein [Gammaproteobacteria bacterium]